MTTAEDFLFLNASPPLLDFLFAFPLLHMHAVAVKNTHKWH